MEYNKKVTVSVRIRPKLEKTNNTLQNNERYEKVACIPSSETVLKLWDGKLTKDSRNFQFTYDNIFDLDATQEDVYENTTVDAVESVLNGANGTLLTYGQTGSGKTYTVLGGMESNPLNGDIVNSNSGILLRAIQDILLYSERVADKKRIILGISAVEIYLDEVRDLLSPIGKTSAPVQVSIWKEIVRLSNLTVVPLEELHDVYDVYKLAVARRVQRATEANDTSSRSHAIFTLEVFQIPKTNENVNNITLEQCIQLRDAYQTDSLDPKKAVKPFSSDFFPVASNPLLGSKSKPMMYSKLAVVDLAGSEKAKHSNVKDEGFEQLRRINASLTALGNVVHCLYEGAKHIPYRDSKLTIVLRDAFASPDAKIALIVNVSPTTLTIDETLSSLYFADKVKAIQTNDIRADPRAMKAEADYLTSLHLYDCLLADIHICNAEYEIPSQAIPMAWRMSHPDPTLLTRLDAQTRTRAMQEASKRLLKTAPLLSGEERMRRYRAVELQKMMKNEIDLYHRRRKFVQDENARVEKELLEAKKSLAEQEKLMGTDLKKYDLSSIRSEVKALQERKSFLSNQLETAKKQENELNKKMSLIEKQYNEPEMRRSQLLTQNIQNLSPAQDAEWDRTTVVAKAAVDWAKLCEEFANLLSDNYALEHNRTPRQRKKYRKRDVTMEEWLRHAVWAMAGNAVTISMKNNMKAARPDPKNLRSLESLPVNVAQQKYWTQERLKAEKAQNEELLGADKSVRKQKRTLRSEYDDENFMSILLSYVDMGANLQRVGHNGSLRKELFYVIKKHDRYRLCWDTSSGRKQTLGRLDGKDHFEVRQITKIVLGQSSPQFSKCAEAGGKSVFRSFSIFYHNSKKDLKCLDLICSSTQEMEKWVILLSKLSGKWPSFEVTSSPEMDDGLGAQLVPAEGMSEEDTTLCQQWLIPSATFMEACDQIRRRAAAKGRTYVEVTPGELRLLTNLDIFRACALWLFLSNKELVRNPLKQLYCYIDPSVMSSSAPRSSQETAGATDDLENHSQVTADVRE